MEGSIAVGARVFTHDGEEIGEVRETRDGAFEVDANDTSHFWLAPNTVLDVEGQRIILSVEEEHLSEFRSDSPEAALDLDAIRILLAMHGEIKARIEDIFAADAPEAGLIWHRLEPDLKLHEQVEEAALYGPVARDDQADEYLRDWLKEHHRQQETISGIVSRLNTASPADDGWRMLLQRLYEALSDHVEQEEVAVFPRIRVFWDEQRLKESGHQMRAMFGDSRY